MVGACVCILALLIVRRLLAVCIDCRTPSLVVLLVSVTNTHYSMCFSMPMSDCPDSRDTNKVWEWL